MNLDNRICFLHIQKTAGTSFTNVVRDVFSNEKVHHFSNFNDLYSKTDKVGTDNVDFFFGHLPFYDFFIFCQQPRMITFLRNPVDRVLSQYYHHQNYFRHLNKNCSNPFSGDKINFEEFCELSSGLAEYMDLPKGRFSPFQDYDNAMVRAISGIGRKCNAGEVDEVLLELAKRNLDKMWFFGISEQLEESMKRFFIKAGKFETFKNVYDPLRYFEKQSGRPKIDSEVNNEMAKSLTKYDSMLYEYALEKFTNQ